MEKLGPREPTYKNEKGQARPIVMGHVRLSIDRLIASAVESHHDKSGIIWPKELAPFPALLCTVNPKNESIAKASEQIYQKLMAAGVDTLWDDRDVTPGVKFKDADLVGIPIRITVGNKTVRDGTVDLKLRSNPEQTSVSSKGVVESVRHALKDYRI
jgi:prolyl-tRNA synthetase